LELVGLHDKMDDFEDIILELEEGVQVLSIFVQCEYYETELSMLYDETERLLRQSMHDMEVEEAEDDQAEQYLLSQIIIDSLVQIMSQEVLHEQLLEL